MNHKRNFHFKQKLCTFYHNKGYCRYSDQQCTFIHRSEETQGYDQGQGQGQHGVPGQVHHQQGGQEHRQSVQGQVSSAQCTNGNMCRWAARNKCKFFHSQADVNVANNYSGQQHMSGSTNTFNMQDLIARLERMESKVPNLQSMQDFPLIGGKQKTN